MQTLQQFQSGKLIGEKRLKLACGLFVFPREIFDMAETLEVLDLTDNNLNALPDDFGRLVNLKILFLSNNQFTEVPKVLAECPKLSMIGIRNNHIVTFEENALPLSTRWLILTDNLLKTLPKSIGDLKYLQKCMLSGNQLTSLPKTLSHCHNLELLRLSANKLAELPSWLLTLPKLSWLAYGGNPFCAKHPACDVPLKEIAWDALNIKEVLGEGASGLISKATYIDDGTAKEVAVKVFKGEMTSDGLPEEEMDINISMGHHDHLVDVLARVTGHPEGKDVLMLELIPSHFYNLGLPPTLETCTKDTYPENCTLTLQKGIKILKGMASAAVHMHERGIMHGDFYAHNIMINDDGDSILGDFGGASYYEPKALEMRTGLERLEVRAFGCLIEEILLLSQNENASIVEPRDKLILLKNACLNKENSQRPLFNTILESIRGLEMYLN